MTDGMPIDATPRNSTADRPRPSHLTSIQAMTAPIMVTSAALSPATTTVLTSARQNAGSASKRPWASSDGGPSVVVSGLSLPYTLVQKSVAAGRPLLTAQ